MSRLVIWRSPDTHLLVYRCKAGAFRHPAGDFHSPTFGAPGRGSRRTSTLSAPFLNNMVQIVEHNGAGPAREEVASSAPPLSQYHASRHTARTPHASRHHVPNMVAPVVQQCTSAQATSMGPLAAARELLRNPPGAAASPDAMAQWQADVDHLIHMAQVTPGSSRAGAQPPPNNAPGSQRRRHGNASASVRSPTVRAARTEDLRA